MHPKGPSRGFVDTELDSMPVGSVWWEDAKRSKKKKKKVAALTFFTDPPPRLSGLSLTTSRGKCEMISESKIQMLRGVSRGAGRKTFHTA